MPVYELFCKCGVMDTRVVPMNERDAQVCMCGNTMRRKISVPGLAIIRQTGNDMALSSLNTKKGGFPNDQYKADAVYGTVAGLAPRKSKYIGVGADLK